MTRYLFAVHVSPYPRLLVVLAAVAFLSLHAACGDGSDTSSHDATAAMCDGSPGTANASLDEYYRDCATNPCEAPYECVELAYGEEPFYACLIPCCSMADCPSDHGCVGVDLNIADYGKDGYCADPQFE